MSCAHEVAGRGQTRERSRKTRETSGIDADGQSVWSWHPLLVSSLAEAHSAQRGYEMPCNPWGDGGKTNSSPGRGRPVKTTAWGMPDDSGASAVNTRAHTSLPQRARGCGCMDTRHSPRPLLEESERFDAKTRADHAARSRMRVWIDVIASAREAIHAFLANPVLREISGRPEKARRTGYPLSADMWRVRRPTT